MNIEPRPKIIVLKRCEMKNESDGGILIPDNTARYNEDKVAVVVKVGSDIECVKPGDVVAFSASYVNVVALSREDTFIFCRESNILAVLK